MASEISGLVTVAVVFNASTAVVCRDVRNEIGAGPCGEILPYIPLIHGEMEISEDEGRRILQEVFVATLGLSAELRCIIPWRGALWWELKNHKLLWDVNARVLAMCRAHLPNDGLRWPHLSAMYLGPAPDKFRSTTRCHDGSHIAEPALVRIDPSTSAITEFLLKSPVPVDSVH
jgi:hypothetical protein